MDQASLLDWLYGIAYLVDPAGRILAYGRTRWNAFAAANGAPELCEPDNVIGLSVLDVVQGEEVRATYRSLMDEVLADERDGVAFGFSCDAPAIRREMAMALTQVRARGEVTGILFHSIILRTEVRPPLDIFRFRDLAAILNPGEPRPMVTICSYCQRVRSSAEPNAEITWVAAEEYYRRGGDSEVQVSHGICPDCRIRIQDS